MSFFTNAIDVLQTLVIALTAYAYEHDKQAALEAGCNDFLTKPFTQEVLKETIKKWLDNKG